MSGHAGTATGSTCPLCGGPCQEPFRLPPIHSNYPFMSEEAIAMTQPTVETEPPPTPKSKRAVRPRENGSKHPSENRAHTPGENR